jgi:hypothetical protein
MRTGAGRNGGDGWLYAAAAAFVLALFLLHRNLLGAAPVFPMDDAYITLHNAEAFWLGGDPNYANASPLTGATSVVHLGLVILLASLFPAITAQVVVMWLAVLAYALGLARLCRANKTPPGLTALVTLVGLFAGQTPYQLTNGLETGLAMAAVVWALALASDHESGQSRLWLAGLCGTLPYVRPELAALALPLLALQAGRRVREAAAAGDPADAALRPILTDFVIAGLCAAPWALWCQTSLGTPFPTSAEAKRLFFAQSALPPLVRAGGVWEGLAGWGRDVGLLLLACVPLARIAHGRASAIFAVCLLGAYWLYFPWALPTYEFRYLYPLLPLPLLGAAVALGSARPPAIRYAAAVLLVLCLGQIGLSARGNIGKYLSYRDTTRYHLIPVVRWCRDHLPPGARVLVHDAGYIARGADLRLTDMVGLKTPASVAYHRVLTYPSGGRQRVEAISRIALVSHADFLIVLRLWERDFGIARGLWERGWDVRPINQDYAWVVYALSPPAPSAGSAFGGGIRRPAPPPSGMAPWRPGDIRLGPESAEAAPSVQDSPRAPAN